MKKQVLLSMDVDTYRIVQAIAGSKGISVSSYFEQCVWDSSLALSVGEANGFERPATKPARRQNINLRDIDQVIS